ncbi:uncharacterized protein LOC104891808 isoform X2 [Beta vulgaris subsp. vulgaris]|uniref:uncharacterized protein LOC104891808 isoform X2 n=1 Tax=Beta vulgaris subsp. vulgaris TaxID=3555 RepID=UPI002547B80E|nr:uncharacterized protein LOC104891808 isoform X2 [Beta vulgaris subsp. vulgaris]
MGFANLVSSLNSHVLITQNFEKFIPKLQSFKQREETQFMNFKLSRRSKSFQKIEVGCCKNGNLIDFEERTSANEIAYMLGSTTWTGAGPGLMDAAIRGALQAGKPVGGFKIEKEAGQWSSTGSHPYLPPDTYLTCRFFSARKHGFVDAAVRNSPSDRTAVVALPGGIGTLDEMFEILALIQLQRIGSELPVPFLLMNYDGYYTKLLDFLDECEHWGNLAKGEVESLWKVFGNNNEALAYLAEFYGLPLSNEEFDEPIINNV